MKSGPKSDTIFSNSQDFYPDREAFKQCKAASLVFVSATLWRNGVVVEGAIVRMCTLDVETARP